MHGTIQGGAFAFPTFATSNNFVHLPCSAFLGWRNLFACLVASTLFTFFKRCSVRTARLYFIDFRLINLTKILNESIISILFAFIQDLDLGNIVGRRIFSPQTHKHLYAVVLLVLFTPCAFGGKFNCFLKILFHCSY